MVAGGVARCAVRKNLLYVIVLLFSVRLGASSKTREVYMRDPSKVHVSPGCEFYVPHGTGQYLNVYSGNGHFWEFYHFLIDFAPRMLEALQTAPNCPKGSPARVWVIGSDNYEHYHLSLHHFCPLCSDTLFAARNWTRTALTLEYAQKVNLYGQPNTMQPQFDFLFQDWGPPVMADVGYGYGVNLTRPETAIMLPYVNKTDNEKTKEDAEDRTNT